MRPERKDIAAPPFPPGIDWVGGDPPRLERLVNQGPLLVHFFDFAQLNSIRALDYVIAWQRAYREHGLGVLGAHSPRFPFTRSAEAVAAALPRMGIDWPVAVDAEFAIWRDYGSEGWPSLFLWGKGGALRWYHLGEGEYQATEEEIRDALGDPANGGWPDPVEPLRPSDAPGAGVVPPTPELFPGGSITTPWKGGGVPLTVDWEAAAAHAAVAGKGELRFAIDGAEQRTLSIEESGLYQLAGDELHDSHRLELEADAGVAVYSLQFAPGPPR